MKRHASGVAIAIAVAVAPAAGACGRRVAGGRADGAAIFAEVCARCHGPGGSPPPAMVAQLGVHDLTSPELQERMSDEAIARQVQHGSPNQKMPSFASVLSDAQVRAVVAHVRTLGRPR